MKFPAVNISNKNWHKDEDYTMYILENQFIYNIDVKLFHNYFLDNLFVDSNGDVYKIVDRILPHPILQFFSFIPNICKVELVFVRTTGRMGIEEVRTHMLNQLIKLDKNNFKDEWIEKVKRAQSYEEIIF